MSDFSTFSAFDVSGDLGPGSSPSRSSGTFDLDDFGHDGPATSSGTIKYHRHNVCQRCGKAIAHGTPPALDAIYRKLHTSCLLAANREGEGLIPKLFVGHFERGAA
jgi:hypothetical protein